MKVHEKAVSVCEEFTDNVLFDRTRYSIVVNIKVDYFRTVKKELEKLGYKLIFTNRFEDSETITCTFKL